jgi:manganese transport protein
MNTPTKSLSEVHRTVDVPKTASFIKKLIAFSGPGYLVAVGYMDPGNWATDLAGGSQFGYALLFVIACSSVIAMILQHLAAKVGIVTGRDLAQLCRESYSRPVSLLLWISAELMIIACDLAEVIGSAIALNLLFGIPLALGIIITAADVLLLLLLQNKGFRYLEALIMVLIATIVACFSYELALSHPMIGPMLAGFIPTTQLFTNTEMLFIALGIIGATVMPHNLFIHSSVVQTRRYEEDEEGKREAVKFATIDSMIALTIAFFVNAAILIVAAAAFYATGNTDVTEIQDAYHLLAPVLGVSFAGILFGVALLAAGQNSTITGTLAGQIIMEGFLNWRIAPWLRRIITRLIAIVPALAVILFFQDYGLGKLLVLSQVILSLQLPFIVIPLVRFSGDWGLMGPFTNGRMLASVSCGIAAILVVLNGWLIYSAIVL